ncbi:hypothetical protein P5V15_010586 [Pogonomyrmex californicus]
MACIVPRDVCVANTKRARPWMALIPEATISVVDFESPCIYDGYPRCMLTGYRSRSTARLLNWSPKNATLSKSASGNRPSADRKRCKIDSRYFAFAWGDRRMCECNSDGYECDILLCLRN